MKKNERLRHVHQIIYVMAKLIIIFYFTKLSLDFFLNVEYSCIFRLLNISDVLIFFQEHLKLTKYVFKINAWPKT